MPTEPGLYWVTVKVGRAIAHWTGDAYPNGRTKLIEVWAFDVAPHFSCISLCEPYKIIEWGERIPEPT